MMRILTILHGDRFTTSLAPFILIAYTILRPSNAMKSSQARALRKPFVSTKAVSHAVLRSGLSSRLNEDQISQIWQIAGDQYTQRTLEGLFQSILDGGAFQSLFEKTVYWIDGSEMLFKSGGRKSTPIRILGECLYQQVRRGWPPERSKAKQSISWNDFTLALFELIFDDGHASETLMVYRLELDLGL